MQDHISAAVPVFLKSCARFSTRADVAPLDAMAMSVDFGRVGDWRSLCEAAEALPSGDDAAAREFFEKDFTPFAVADYDKAEGLFTGYYEIELTGSRQRRGRYQTPLYRKPPDLGPEPPTRAEIEDGALAGRGLELLWVDDPIDAFFLQIQGSGRVRLKGGGTVRVGYDGQNGRPYVPVGRLLIERGVIPRDKLTMAAIRSWMKRDPEAGAGCAARTRLMSSFGKSRAMDQSGLKGPR
jgi:membrane-bound lytic murein transglycosylase A